MRGTVSKVATLIELSQINYEIKYSSLFEAAQEGIY